MIGTNDTDEFTAGGDSPVDRRTFLRAVGLGSLAAGTGATGLLDEVIARPVRPRIAPLHTTVRHWAWTRVTADQTTDRTKQQFAELRDAGVEGILLGGGDAETHALAHAAGLQTHAWMWTVCRRDQVLMDEHADWYAVSREGKSTHEHPPYVPYYRFLCPTRPEVRSYLAERVAELAAAPGLAGVHLDYVRYPDVILPRSLWEKYDLVQNEELPPFDFCYCETCRAQFGDLTGKDPLELPDPPADAAWRQFRWNTVTRLVNELVEVVHAHSKQITAAVFPSPTVARKLVRQNWPQWQLDAVLPMVYHNFYNEPISWIEQAVAEGVISLPPDRPLYAGLYLPSLKTEAEFNEAVECALRGGASGVALFGGVRKIPG